jgi:ATP-binding cassette subfamily B protein/subfamily B ATP-binding cassette protein MsbA
MVAVDWRRGLTGLVVAPLMFLTANHFAGLTRQYARRKREPAVTASCRGSG